MSSFIINIHQVLDHSQVREFIELSLGKKTLRPRLRFIPFDSLQFRFHILFEESHRVPNALIDDNIVMTPLERKGETLKAHKGKLFKNKVRQEKMRGIRFL